jgi:hypothetical protein
MIVGGADTMATLESQKRSERRRHQRWWEELNRQPEVIALRREIARRARSRRRHPFAGQTASQPGPLWLYCLIAGMHEGGRAWKGRRCTKRLGTRMCWNWRQSSSDRCHRHQRERGDQ